MCALCLVTQSCLTLCDSMDCSLPASSVHGDSPGMNMGMGCHALLKGIFPTQGSNPGLPHCRWILHSLSHEQSPRVLEWVAYPFSRESSQLRNQTGISCIAGRFFTTWATREAPHKVHNKTKNQVIIVRTKDYCLCRLTFANKRRTLRRWECRWWESFSKFWEESSGNIQHHEQNA